MGDGVCEGVLVCDGDCVRFTEGVPDGDVVGDGVKEGDMVRVGVPETEAPGDPVPVLLAVSDGVIVCDGVGVCVGVGGMHAVSKTEPALPAPPRVPPPTYVTALESAAMLALMYDEPPAPGPKT